MIDPAAGSAIRGWLKSGGTLKLRVLSDSMWPLIRAGDSIEVGPVDPGSLRWGDVVLLELDGRYVAHRVRRVRPALVTRGDNARGPDPAISTDGVLGRVITIGGLAGLGVRRSPARAPAALVAIALSRVRRVAYDFLVARRRSSPQP